MQAGWFVRDDDNVVRDENNIAIEFVSFVSLLDVTLDRGTLEWM